MAWVRGFCEWRVGDWVGEFHGWRGSVGVMDGVISDGVGPGFRGWCGLVGRRWHGLVDQ